MAEPGLLIRPVFAFSCLLACDPLEGRPREPLFGAASAPTQATVPAEV